jgi:ATP-dependent Clp protease adaptor protein ClpS
MDTMQRPSLEQEIDFAEAVPEEVVEEAFEPLYLILVHNDDKTPVDYVVRLLEVVFRLSHELAEHVTATAEDDGVAVVLVRPRDEAKRLIDIANGRARADGHPLLFTMEPER